jgi:2-aminomuconate deaminase
MSEPKATRQRTAPEPVGAFPHAKRVGDFLFLSGSARVARHEGDPRRHRGADLAVFKNVRLVLEDAGATWDDIVDVTVFLTDNDRGPFPRVLNRPSTRSTSRRNRPTRTTVEVGALPDRRSPVELKVIAYLKVVSENTDSGGRCYLDDKAINWAPFRRAHEGRMAETKSSRRLFCSGL